MTKEKSDEFRLRSARAGMPVEWPPIPDDISDWFKKMTGKMISDAFLDAAALRALTSERYQKMSVAYALGELVHNGIMRAELIKEDVK